MLSTWAWREPHGWRAGWVTWLQGVRGARRLLLAADGHGEQPARGAGELGARQRAGEAERVAFEAFFRRHERDIFSYLWRLTSDEQSAYDLSQEAFMRAWQHFASIHSYQRPEAWLFRVASNLAFSHLRRRKGPVGSATPLPDEGGPATSDPAWRLAERDSVRRTLDGMPPRQRAALLLREVYGLSGDDLAAALGISTAAAKMLLTRGREHFREGYRRQEGPV